MPVLLVAVAQIAAGIALYRARTVHGWTAGDWLILYCAPVAGFVANVLLLRVPAIARRHGITDLDRAIEMSFVIAAIAFFTTLLVSLNVFGS